MPTTQSCPSADIRQWRGSTCARFTGKSQCATQRGESGAMNACP